jgi:hypothetical protein
MPADLAAMKQAGPGGAIFWEVDVGIPRGPLYSCVPNGWICSCNPSARPTEWASRLRSDPGQVGAARGTVAAAGAAHTVFHRQDDAQSVPAELAAVAVGVVWFGDVASFRQFESFTLNAKIL